MNDGGGPRGQHVRATEDAGRETGPDRPDDAVAGRSIDRKRLDDIFGDVLPDTTSDEREDGPSGDRSTDEWYRQNRPPHHGG